VKLLPLVEAEEVGEALAVEEALAEEAEAPQQIQRQHSLK